MLDKLKSLFFEKVESDKTESQQKVEKVSKEKIVQTAPKPELAAPIGNQKSGNIDNKLLNVLASAVQKANVDGFDYLEYKESIKSLEKMDMSEATRYQSAFAMAKTMGANAQRLIQSAEYYLGMLDEERKKFAGVIEHQRREKIGDKEERIKQMKELVQQKLQEIEKIKQEINQLNTEIEKENKSIEGAQNKIQQTKVNFEATFNQVYSSIQKDIERMKSYLK